MARKKKEVVQLDAPVNVGISENLTIEQKFTVVKAFRGSYNDRKFDCKIGDKIILNDSELIAYSRFIKKD